MQIKSTHPSHYGIVSGSRFYVLNVFEALDQEGEWYLDRESEQLYLCASKVPLNGDKYYYGGTHRTLFELDGVDGVTFNNLAVKYDAGKRIVATGCKDLTIASCDLSLISDTVVQGLSRYGYHIEDTKFMHLGAGGISPLTTMVIAQAERPLIAVLHAALLRIMCAFTRRIPLQFL